MLRSDRAPDPGGARPDLSAARGRAVPGSLASRIADHQRFLGAPEAAVRAAEGLGRPDAAVVVAGQQPGLLGGPLFTLAKALSAIAWARTWTRESGRPVTPVFWAATEDHDLDEVNRVDVLDREDRRRTLRLDLAPEGRMLSHVDPGPGAEQILDTLAGLLPASEFLDGIVEDLRGVPRPSLGRWFTGILARWLGPEGLVVVEPSLFRTAAAPLLRLGRERPEAIREACGEGPVEVAPVPFFRVENGVRTRPGGPLELPEDPARVSFDVVTRVLAQDLVLPVAGHVVGPSEADYCRQVAPAHALLGIPAPPLLPRARLLLVEGKVERALEAFGCGARDVAEGGEEVLRGSGAEPHDFERALGELEAAMRRALEGLKGEAERVDEVLSRKTAGAEKEWMRAIDRLREHGRKAMDRATGRDLARRSKVLAHLRPGGGVQERALSPLPFLARHGKGLLAGLLEVVETDPSARFTVYLAKRGG